jgi:hypothetical protein
MSIESDERRQLDGRGASMIDRKPFENGSNPGREREEAVLRGVSGWLEPSKPWLARRNGISSAFRSRHMGNDGYYQPWQFWNIMITAQEYLITDKIFFGTDFLFATVADSLAGIRAQRSRGRHAFAAGEHRGDRGHHPRRSLRALVAWPGTRLRGHRTREPVRA